MSQRMRRSRMFGWDGNPVRRRIDRLEGYMVAGLIGVFLISAPVLAAVAGHLTSIAVARQEYAKAGWRQVPATVQRSGTGQQNDSPGPENTVWMRARWTAPDGKQRSGWVPVSPGTAAGSRVLKWVSRSGATTPPRAQRGDPEGWIAISEVLTPCALALVLGVAGYEGRLFFARRRLAQWGEQCREQCGEP
jgi:hypothetical protein